MSRAARIALALALALAAGPGARARSDAETSPLELAIEIRVVGRELLAIDAASGGETPERLERGEVVLFTRERGRVGIAVTDRRMLAVTTRSGAWQSTRYRNGESPPDDVELGDRVALFVTPVRAIGFDGKTGNLVESTLGPRERLVDRGVGQNVAVVVTDRRALGVSSHHGGFFETRLRVGEVIEGISPYANHATVRTSERLLVFRGPTSSWEELRKPLR